MRRLAIPATARVLTLVAVAIAAVAVACGGGSIKDAEDVVVADKIEFKIPGEMS